MRTLLLAILALILISLLIFLSFIKASSDEEEFGLDTEDDTDLNDDGSGKKMSSSIIDDNQPIDEPEEIDVNFPGGNLESLLRQQESNTNNRPKEEANPAKQNKPEITPKKPVKDTASSSSIVSSSHHDNSKKVDFKAATKDYDPRSEEAEQKEIAEVLAKQQKRKDESMLTRGQLNKRYVPLQKRKQTTASSSSQQQKQQSSSGALSTNLRADFEIADPHEGKERLIILWYAPYLSFSGYGSEALEFAASIWRSILPALEVRTPDHRPNLHIIRDDLKHHSENLTFSLFNEDDDEDESDATSSDTTNASSFSVSSFGCFHHGDEQKMKVPSLHTAEYLACRNTGNGLAMASPTIVEPNWHLLQPHPSRMIIVCHSNQGMWSLPKSDYPTLSCPPTVHPVLARVGRTMFETDSVPLNWFRRFVQMDELWVPTEFHKRTFLKSFEEYLKQQQQEMNNNNTSSNAVDLDAFAQKLRIIPEPIDTELWRRQDEEYADEYIRMIVLNEVDRRNDLLLKEQKLSSLDEADPADLEMIEDDVIRHVETSFRIPVMSRNTRNRLNALSLLSNVNVAPDYMIDDPVYGIGPTFDRIPGVTPKRDKDDDADCDDRILDLQDRFNHQWIRDTWGQKVKIGLSLRQHVLHGNFFELNAYRLGDRSSWGETKEGLRRKLRKLKRLKIRKMREELRHADKMRGLNQIEDNPMKQPPPRFPGMPKETAADSNNDKNALEEKDPFAFGAGSGILVHSDDDHDERKQLIPTEFEASEEIDDEEDDMSVMKKGGSKKCLDSRVFISTFKRERRKGWDILVRAFVEQFTSRSKRLSRNKEEAEIQKAERNINSPCLILHTNEFAEDLPIDFPGTVDLFLEFLYGEIFVKDSHRFSRSSEQTQQQQHQQQKKDKSEEEEEEDDDDESEDATLFDSIEELTPEQEKFFIETQQQEQEREKEEAIASMSQLWKSQQNSMFMNDDDDDDEDSTRRKYYAQSQEEVIRNLMKQERPSVVDRVTAARLALHQRKELLIDLEEHPQDYFDLCKLRCVSSRNRLFEKVNEDEKPTCQLCERMNPNRKFKKNVTLSEKARIWRRLMRERLEVNDAPVVLFTSKALSFEEYRNLIISSDVNVLTTRGEGWGRPVQEAMSLAVPSIVTNWSGPASFSHKNFSFLIPIHEEKNLRTVPDDLWFGGHQWAEPSVAKVRRLLNKVELMKLDELRTMGAKAREYVVEHLDVSVVGKQVVEATKELAAKKVNDEKKNRKEL